jgi:transcription initiation factor TFIID TATA-box-binding protein
MEIASMINVHQGELLEHSNPDFRDFAYKIINVVALGTLKLKNNAPLNFDELEQKIVIRRLNRFPSVIFKIDNISIILFKNGKMILTGIKDRDEIPNLQEKVGKFLIDHAIEFEDFSIKIQNLIAMSNLGRIINLEMVCLTLTNCLYEPEQFPAAIVKPKTGGAFLLFSNSKIITLGMRDLTTLEKSLRSLIQDLFDYNLFLEQDRKFDDFDELGEDKDLVFL